MTVHEESYQPSMTSTTYIPVCASLMTPTHETSGGEYDEHDMMVEASVHAGMCDMPLGTHKNCRQTNTQGKMIPASGKPKNDNKGKDRFALPVWSAGCQMQPKLMTSA